MSDTPNPNLNSNTPNQETNPEPSSNLEQSSEHNPNSEQAQSSDASNQESTSLSASALATLCLIGALIGVLPFIPSFLNIAAIAMGHSARSKIRKNPNESGAGVALIGLILGYIGWLTGPILLAVTVDAFTDDFARAMKAFFISLLVGASNVMSNMSK